MSYQDFIQALLEASGKVETIINGSPSPTKGQVAFLAFCQNDLKNAIVAAQSDPDLQ